MSVSTPPDYIIFRTFGCTCYVLPLNERTKLSTDQLSVSYLTLVLSIRIITVMIPWHVFLYPVMSPSLRTLLIFHLHLRMYIFCRHLIHRLLSLLDFLLI